MIDWLRGALGRRAHAEADVDSGGDYLELATHSGETIQVLRRSHPRARHLRLTVTSSGPRVTYPEGTHPAQVLAFVRKHGDWLQRKLGELNLDAAPLPLQPGVDTLTTVRGQVTALLWQDASYPELQHSDVGLILSVPRNHPRARECASGLLRSYLEMQIRRDVSRWLAHYTAVLGRAPTTVRVRPLKSLWGSLDTRDGMSLDLALALAPPLVLKYVVIHELCHLRVRSHAPRFWALVETLMPDWRVHRTWLRSNGQALKGELNRLL
ncbi:MAG: SprT family zinc-dependent metalloprotease [Dokdonella sp.]